MEESLPQLLNTHDGSTVKINNLAFSIGRSLSCDHIIESLGVSRFHCIIKKSGDKWTLYDRSTNGTRVNDVLYRFNQWASLKSGDVVKLGPENETYVFTDPNEVIQLDADDPTPPPPLSPHFELPSVLDDPKFDDDLVVVDQTSNPGSLCTDIQEDDMSEDIAELMSASAAGEFELSLEPAPRAASPAQQEPKAAGEGTSKGGAAAETNLDIMESELTCSVCSELFIKAVTLACSHTFCKFCIDEWRKNKSCCPICRKEIGGISPTLVLDNFIARIVETQTDEVRAVRDDIIRQRQEMTPGTAGCGAAPAPAASNSVIEIFSEDDDDEEDETYSAGEDSYYDYSNSYDEFRDDEDFSDQDGDEDYNGVPGHYYGGYGRCYICNRSGHWANGCPLKRTRR